MNVFGLDLAEDAFRRLDSILRIHAAGCEWDYTTPLLRSCMAAPSDVMRDEMAASFINHCKLDGLPMWLREAEYAQRRKIGTFSKVPGYCTSYGSEISLATQVQRYFDPHKVHIEPGASIRANKYIASLVSCGSGVKLSATTLGVAAESFIRRTGYGWPVISSDGAYGPQIYGLSESFISSDAPVPLVPAIVGSRGQSRGLHMRARNRLIFQCSRVVGNVEKMFFLPMFAELRHLPMFAAWQGQDAVDWAVSGLFEDSAGPFLSVDYSGFDASVPNIILRHIFRVIKQWFDPSHGELISRLENQFIHCGIITPEGHIIGRSDGIPSGSVLTNLVGSLVNLWVMAYAAHRCGVTIHRSLIQGDDGVFSFNGSVNPADLASVIRADLGMTLSTDKSYYDKDEIHYLSNIHRRTYKVQGKTVGIRPLMRVLNGMMSYERFQSGWTGHMDTLRWFQQLDNARNHPCYLAACEFLLAHDKYARLDVPELIRHAGGIDAVNVAIGAWSDGIRTTPTIRLERSPTARAINFLISGR